MKFLKEIFLTIFLVICIFPSFSQGFYRIIEVKSPRMNGPDVLNLQKRLLSLGFYELGEADGYYGPMTEDIIKRVKNFSGYEIDGTVNKYIWDFIFSVENNALLRNISTISKYNIGELQNSGNIYDNTGLDFAISAFVYYSVEDKNVKIVQFNRRDYMTEISCTYYLVNDTNYFVKQYFSDEYSFKEPSPYMTIINRILYIENNEQYEILNGNKVLSNEDYYISVISTMENIIKVFKRIYD
jgi:peptidoglycan hydrolase-like protein with peptidoglycan-binding domain